MSLIYKLYDELDCYIGSTTLTLTERLEFHIKRRNCKAIVILDRCKYKIELIEEVETNDRYEREQYYIDSLSTLNQQICYSGKEDKRNKSILCECGVYYSLKHKARHNKTERHLKRTDPICIEKEKQFQEDKKKRQVEYKAQWYKDNQDKYVIYNHKKTNNDNITCECGGKYKHQSKARHLKTLKHLAYIDAEGQKSNQS
tara:strand:- start:142 stop:741 length:600 start_codon:yes stop_codon:yes gene_type:complete